MIPQRAHQIIPGAANDTRESFSWSIFMGSEVLAYASGKYVVIYQGNTMTQVLHGHREKITCVEWCKAYGKLVACSRGRIVVYVPDRDSILSDEEQMNYVEECQGKISTRWTVDQVIEMDDSNMVFECACWNLFGDRLLLSGGDRLLLYELALQPASAGATATGINVSASAATATPATPSTRTGTLTVSKSKADLNTLSSSSSVGSVTPSPTSATSQQAAFPFSPTSSTPSTPKANTMSDFNSFRSGGGAKFQLVWEYVNPTPVFSVEFSPDERFFVTVAKNDRLVKVWYRVRPTNENEPDDFTYIYLPHPRGVTSVCWRHSELQQQGSGFFANVLLTVAKDNVMRVWTETNENEDLNFHICYATRMKQTDSSTVVQWLNTPHEVSPNEVLLNYMKKISEQKIYDGGHRDLSNERTQKMKLNRSTADLTQLESSGEQAVKFDHKKKPIMNKGSDTGDEESQSWLGSILHDGTLTIDLIQGLADFPRRTPKQSPWIRMPNALKGFEDPLRVIMFYRNSSSESEADGYGTPNKLIIYVHSRNGVISSWNLHLGKGSKTPTLKLFKVFTGHIGAIDMIATHPLLPLVATVDSSHNQVITWHTRDTAYFTPEDVLTNIKISDISATKVAWHPCLPSLFASTEKGIELFHVKTECPSMHDLGPTYETAIFPPLPSYYDVVPMNLELEKSSDFSSCLFLKAIPVSSVIESEITTVTISAFVVAISSDGKSLAVWKVHETETSNPTIPSYQSKLLLSHTFKSGGRVVSADCEKLIPFLYSPTMLNSSRILVPARAPTEKPSSLVVEAKQIQQPSIILMTGTDTGKVLVFKLGFEEKKVEAKKPVRMGGLLGKLAASQTTTPTATLGDKYSLVKWMEYQVTSDSSIQYLKCCDIPTRFALGLADGKTVQIWEAEGHTEYSLEQTITMLEDETITHFQWQSFGDGQYLLSMGTNKGVQIYTQSKISKYHEASKYWKKVCDLMSNMDNECCNWITTTKDGTLIAAFGMKLCVYTRWLKVWQNDENAQTIRSKSLQMHRRLPDYHPRLLADLMMSGQFELVKEILIHLAKHLKMYIDKLEKEKSSSFLDVDIKMYIPSLSISMLLQNESTTDTPKKRLPTDNYSFLNRQSEDEENENSTKQSNSSDELSFEDAYIILRDNLMRATPPDLQGKEAMYLIALIDTVNQIQMKPDALDDCSIRFLLAYKLDQFMSVMHAKMKRSTDKGAIEPEMKPMDSAYIAWAFHSESHDTLFQMLNLPETLTWDIFRKLGLSFWMRNPNVLRKVAEKLAQDQFKKTNDPTTCALMYVALKKKSTLIGLFKVKDMQKLVDFYRKDFTQPQEIVAACKNAYVLISRQNFHYAAAFFLLADKPEDAIDILIKREQDVDLAYMVARLYCGDDSPLAKKVLENHCLPKYQKENDVWMQATAYWTLKRYEDAIKVLVERLNKDDDQGESFDTSLFAFCSHLSSKFQLANSTIFEENRDSLILRTSYHFVKTGSSLLAIEHLKKLGDGNTKKSKVTDTKKTANINSGMLDMGSFGGFGGFGMSGGMGMNMGMGMGGFNPVGASSASSNASSNKEAPVEIDRTDFVKMMKFKICLSILAQELFDISKQDSADVSMGWDKNKKKLNDLFDDLVTAFSVDKIALRKKLREFTELNGMLIARCLLTQNTKSMVNVLETFSNQVVTSLSLLVKSALTRSQSTHMEHLAAEFAYCYERCKLEKGNFSDASKADIAATVYTLLFMISWSKRDFHGLLLLFTLPAKMQASGKHQRRVSLDLNNSEKRTKTDPLELTLGEDPAKFYYRFTSTLEADKLDRIMTQEIEKEERKRGKKTNVKADEEEKKKKLEAFIARYHSIGDSGVGSKAIVEKADSGVDTTAERLKIQFHWQLFYAVVVYKFTLGLKNYLERVYEKATGSIPSLTPADENNYSARIKSKLSSSSSIGNFRTVQYTQTARTVVTCLTLWCSYLNRKLVYKELEVFTASKEHPTPSFKDVNALSEPTQLSNIVNALAFGQNRGSHARHRHFRLRYSHSLNHAIPELNSNNNDHSFFSSIDGQWLQDKDSIKTFDYSSDCVKLWKYLTSDESLMPPSVTFSSIRKETTPEAPAQRSIRKDSRSDDKPLFSADIEIVKCKDVIRAFCVDRNNPNNLAYSTSKVIREVNIDHSIRYRKRNQSLDKLMDEEAQSWEASLHRFDAVSMHDNTSMKTSAAAQAHVPSNSSFNLFDFINPATMGDDIDEHLDSENEKVARANKFVGIGNEGFHGGNTLNKLKKRLNLTRRPSFTTNSPSASHFKNTPKLGKKRSTTAVDHNVSVVKLLTHPFLPFYLSGGADGSVHMWQYGIGGAVRTYKEDKHPAITSLHFSRFGYKFGATDASGLLTLWRFEASKDSLQPFDVVQCHSGRANDFTFLDSGSMIATIGVSSNGGKTLKIWDLLMPPFESCIYLYSFHDEPCSIIHSSKYRCLFVGTKRGDVFVFDVKTKSLIYSFNTGASTPIDVLTLDVSEDFFVTGSGEGDVQIWATQTLEEINKFGHCHSKYKFSIGTTAPLGVTDCDLSSNFLYTAGADGRILRRIIM